MSVTQPVIRPIVSSVVRGIFSGVGGGLSYLLRATFTTTDQSLSDGQVLGSGDGVEAGSLTMTVAGGGTANIVSNRLRMVGSGGWERAVAYSATGYTRYLGRAMMNTYTFTGSGVQGQIGAWFYDISGLIPDFSKVEAGGYNPTTASFRADFRTSGIAGKNVDTGNPMVASTEYSIAIILGGYNSSGTPYQTGGTKADFTYGCTWFIKGGTYTNWTLVYRQPYSATATLYPVCQAYSETTADYDDIRIPDADLSSTQAANNLNTSVSTADIFTHIADCIIEAKITTLPSSGNLDIEFRRQDDSNKWVCRVTSAGAISLIEVVATVETTRIGPFSPGVANGDRVIIVSEDDNITIFSKEIKRGSYASAANFKTDTGGKIVFGSGAVAYLADWSRGTDAAYSKLDNY